jgi:mRNA-degrading endonuclease toxin of MazEF toxin-antitoxin module
LATFTPGQIVIADWRDALPREPNKLRPAIVVEDSDLFGPAYPNVILVPLTQDHNFAVADLSLSLEPTPENGCARRCYALSLAVATTSKQRIRPTQSHVTPEQLKTIREQIATAIGVRRRSASI